MTQTIRVKFPNKNAMLNILKNALDGFEQGTGQDKVYRWYTKDWSVDYIGKMVDEPAEIDADGNVITPATFWSGEQANIVIHSEDEDVLKDELLTAFTEVNPNTPDRKFAGE